MLELNIFSSYFSCRKLSINHFHMEKTDSNQQKLYFVIGRNFVVRK